MAKAKKKSSGRKAAGNGIVGKLWKSRGVKVTLTLKTGRGAIQQGFKV